MAVQRYRARVISQQSGVNTAGPSNVQDLISLGNQYEATASKVGTRIRADQVKFGNDYGNEILIDDVITLDPETGKPVAFKTSKLTTQAARDAFEDVVQSRFAQGIENQLKLRRTQILEEAKYADDPVSYFNNNFDSYTKERLNKASEGFYANKVSEISGLLKVDGSISANNMQVERNISELSTSLKLEQTELLEDAASLGRSGASISSVMAIIDNKSSSYDSLKELNMLSDSAIQQFERNMLGNYYTGRMANFLEKKDLSPTTLEYIRESLFDKNEIDNIPLSHQKRLGTDLVRVLKNYHEFVSFENIEPMISVLDGVLNQMNSGSDGSDKNTGGNTNVRLNPTSSAMDFSIARMRNEVTLFNELRSDPSKISFSGAFDIGTLSMYEQHYFQDGGVDEKGRPDVLSYDEDDPFGMSPVWIPYAQGTIPEREQAQVAYSELEKLKKEKEKLFGELNTASLPITHLKNGVNSVTNITEDGGGLKWVDAKGQDQILGFIVDYIEQNVDSVFSITKEGGKQKKVRANELLEEIILAGKQEEFKGRLQAFGNYRQARIDEFERIVRETSDKVLSDTEAMVLSLEKSEINITTSDTVDSLVIEMNNRTPESFDRLETLRIITDNEKNKIMSEPSITNKETLIGKLNKAYDQTITLFTVSQINKLFQQYENEFIRDNPEALVQPAFFQFKRRQFFEMVRDDLSANIPVKDLKERDIDPSVIDFFKKERTVNLPRGVATKTFGGELRNILEYVNSNHSEKNKISTYIDTEVLGKIEKNITRINNEQSKIETSLNYRDALGDGSMIGNIIKMGTVPKKEQIENLNNIIGNIITDEQTGKITLSNLFKSEHRNELGLFIKHLNAEGSVAPIQSIFNKVYESSAVGISNEEISDMLTFYRGLRNFNEPDNSASTGFKIVNLAAQMMDPTQLDFFDTLLTLQNTLGTEEFRATVDTIKTRRADGITILKNDTKLASKLTELTTDLDPVSQTMITNYGEYLVGKMGTDVNFKDVKKEIDSYLEHIMPDTDGIIITPRSNTLVNKSPHAISIIAKTPEEKLDFLTNFVLKDVLTHKTIFGNVGRVVDEFGDEKLFTVKMGTILKPVTSGYGFQTTIEDYEIDSSVIGVSGLNEKNKKVLDNIEEIELFMLPIQDFGNLYSKMNIVTTDENNNQLHPTAMYRQLNSDVNYLLVTKDPNLEGEFKPFVWMGVPQVVNFKDANTFFEQRAKERFSPFKLTEEDRKLIKTQDNRTYINMMPVNIGGF